MSNALYTATLVPGSPRYAIWRAILDGDDVPLKCPAPFAAALGDPVKERADVYVVDAARLSDAQFRKLSRWAAERFSEPVESVRETIKREGFPIRAEDVWVAISIRAFL